MVTSQLRLMVPSMPDAPIATSISLVSLQQSEKTLKYFDYEYMPLSNKIRILLIYASEYKVL